jgi:hypothetical protein
MICARKEVAWCMNDMAWAGEAVHAASGARQVMRGR